MIAFLPLGVKDLRRARSVRLLRSERSSIELDESDINLLSMPRQICFTVGHLPISSM